MAFSIELFFLLFFFLADAYFSAAETALSALSLMSARKLRDDNPELADILTAYMENPGRLLTTVIAASSLCIILFSFTASALTSQVLPSQTSLSQRVLSWFLSAFASVFLLLAAEITPKVIAKNYAEKVGVAVLPGVAFIERFLGPLVRLILKLISLLTRPFGSPRISEVPVMTEKEIRQILLEGERDGILGREEREMIHSVMEFGDTLVKEIMVPRVEMFCLNLALGTEACLDKLIDGGYSRVPVYKDHLDNVMGVLYSKDYLTVLKNRDLILLKDALRPAYFVPETKKAADLLREFRQSKIHLAIVVDEHGLVSGLVTLEDLLEEIVGEIYDEYDTVVKWIEPGDDDSYLIDARISVKKVNQELGLRLPERMDATTLSGLVVLLAKKVPLAGEMVESAGVRLEVVDASARRVVRVRLRKVPTGTKGDG